MSGEVGPYGRLARWALDHPRFVVVAAIVVTVVSLFIGVPPDVDSNLMNLLPEDEPAVMALEKINSEEGGVNMLTLAFESDDAEALDRVLDDVVDQLIELEEFDFAMHEIDEDLAKHIGLLQLEPSEIGDLLSRLKGAIALGPAALNPMISQRLWDMGPLTKRIGKMGELDFLQQEANQGKVIARAVAPSHNPKFSQQVMDQVHRVLDDVDPEAAGVDLVWIGGGYRHTVEDVGGIRQDIVRTSVASSILVLSVIMIAFRSVRAVAVVFPPLLVANAINLGLVAIFAGALNTYTSFGTAVLVGLGIDFAIHLVGRYREHLADGVDVEQAIVLAWDQTGPPCATAALTSAAGFLALAAARFGGFSQLGVLLASGLIISLFAMLVLLPLLLRRLDHDAPPLLGTQTPDTVSTSTYRLAPIGLMAAVMVTGVFGAVSLPKLQFEYDISALRRDGMAYEELTESERALARGSYSPVVVTCPNEEVLRKNQARVKDLVDGDHLSHVGQVISLHNVLPSDQSRRNELLRELVALVDEPAQLKYLPTPIIKPLMTIKGLEIDELTRDDLPRSLLRLLGATDETKHRMMLLPRGNMWDVREAQKLSDQVYAHVRGCEVAGEYLGTAAMFRLVLDDAPIVGALAFVLVVILAFIDLKAFNRVAAAVGALVVGMIWAGSALRWSGVKLTMINLAGVPILLGIGIDVVIHLVHRLRAEGPGGVRRALRTTGIAAAVSTLTTIASFFSLTLGGSRGVRSLGQLVVIGLLMVSVLGAGFLTLAWVAGWRLTAQRAEEATNEESS